MKYYEEVGAYYDKDAHDFEKRYWQNPALQRIRQSFREEVKRWAFSDGLEVGIGPGFDLVHFARIFPEAQLKGIDISEEMVKLAAGKIPSLQQANAQVAQGSVEDIDRLFPETKYDLIYVFFGALNTVEDLGFSLQILESLLKPGGRMVLTFVNKWYLAGMLIECLKLRPHKAFKRLAKVWGGYSPSQFLASRCFSPAEIYKLTEPLQLSCSKREGFSILYPAWYYHGLHRQLPKKLLHVLWKIDRKLAAGFFGKFGEYALYDFRKGR